MLPVSALELARGSSVFPTTAPLTLPALGSSSEEGSGAPEFLGMVSCHHDKSLGMISQLLSAGLVDLS